MSQNKNEDKPITSQDSHRSSSTLSENSISNQNEIDVDMQQIKKRRQTTDITYKIEKSDLKSTKPSAIPRRFSIFQPPDSDSESANSAEVECFETNTGKPSIVKTSQAKEETCCNLVSIYVKYFDYVIYEIGDPLPLQFRHVINFWKFGSFAFVLAAMIVYSNYSPAAWMYLALHGSQGWLWLIKDAYFPDKSFDAYLKPSGFIAVNLILVLQLQGAQTLITGWDLLPCATQLTHATEFQLWLRQFIAVFQFVLGAMLMLLADQQKYVMLHQVKKPGETMLIRDGFFSRTRNPNQLGEIMLQFAFAMVADSFLFQVQLLVDWVLIFSKNMVSKDQSLRKKPGGEEQFEKSNVLFPRIVENSIVDSILWICILVGYFQGMTQAGGINVCLV